MTVYTSRFGFKWNYQPHDTGWGTDYNFAHRELAAVLHLYIISDAVTTPPGSPAENDTYLVPLTGTGAWSTQHGKIASYQGGAWQYYTPEAGTRARIANRSGFYWYDGSIWNVELTSGGGTYVQTVAGHAPDISGDVALVVGDITGAAPLSSPTLTGTPLAPTRAANNNSTGIATTEYVDRAITALGGIASVAAGTGIGVAYTSGVYTISVTGSYAPLASPTFTGTPAAPTATAGTNTTQIATTAFVQAGIAALVNSAPSLLDTLGEIATELTSAESTATALATTVSGKVAKAGDTMIGDLHLSAPGGSDNTDKAVSSAWVRTYVTGLGFGTGSGTVTSVDLTMPALFSVTGNPVTGSGTLAVALATQTANRVLAGPTTGSPAAPTMRALVAADLPSMPYDISFFAEGVLTTSEVIARFVVPRTVSLASGASGVAICGTAPTGATAVVTLNKNGSSFGTVTYSTGSTTGTVSITSTTSFAAGDIITWVGPSSVDVTLADPSVTLTATR